MTADTRDPEAVARGTLALLETRLRRLEFLLHGTSKDDNVAFAQSNETLRARLEALDAELTKLKRLHGHSGGVVRDIERLSSTYPDLFSPPTSTSNPPKSEDLSTLASIVLAHATLYPETASRLSSLQPLQVPAAEQSSKLVSLLPRLERLQKDGQGIEEEVRELRERSARCLEWWVNIGVVGMGDLWEEWERRIGEVERNLIRWERRAKDEQGYL